MHRYHGLLQVILLTLRRQTPLSPSPQNWCSQEYPGRLLAWSLGNGRIVVCPTWSDSQRMSRQSALRWTIIYIRPESDLYSQASCTTSDKSSCQFCRKSSALSFAFSAFSPQTASRSRGANDEPIYPGWLFKPPLVPSASRK